jgi:hypothetical protein
MFSSGTGITNPAMYMDQAPWDGSATGTIEIQKRRAHGGAEMRAYAARVIGERLPIAASNENEYPYTCCSALLALSRMRLSAEHGFASRIDDVSVRQRNLPAKPDRTAPASTSKEARHTSG